MKANASKRKIFDAVDMLTENTSAKTQRLKQRMVWSRLRLIP